MRRSAFAMIVITAALAPGACTSDLNAPSNYRLPDVIPPDPEPLEVSCDTIPVAAVDADFTFAIAVSGGDGEYEYSAPDLPDGLMIDDMGAITGRPTAEGVVSFEVSATDGLGGTGSATCELTVRPRLDVDLDAALLADHPYCLSRTQSLKDFIVPGTGDDGPIECDWTGSSGNGRNPMDLGLSIDAESCTVAGSLTTSRFGTHAFVMRGTQNGVSVYLPYCVTNDDADFTYDVSMSHSGIADATLVAIGRTFDPDAPLSVGCPKPDDADVDPNEPPCDPDDPLVTFIHEPSCLANSCYFEIGYVVSASPFDFSAGKRVFTRGAIVRQVPGDNMSPYVGAEHRVFADGPPVLEDFRDRPWVLQVSFNYCLSGMSGGCDIMSGDGDGHLELAIIMVPERP